MQFPLFAAAVAIFATGAVARNCKEDIYYCGYNLLSVGNYANQIQDAMAAVGRGGQDSSDVVFLCLGGSNGDIKFDEQCSGDCVDAGTDKSDHC
ncbi:hypothetical protein V492_01030 [Pseudogymnoascus sp. VKM F-4246]|nr:hypothetical protein V492_01030 [Pseudogymnoascus sp. VKM F-4246]